MKNLFFLFVLLSLAACGGAPEGQDAGAGEAQAANALTGEVTSRPVIAENSEISWVGANFTGGQHTGTINIAEGKLIEQGGQIVGGGFVIDMNTIANTDLPDDKKADLVGHLTNGDFFETNKFPHAMFEITSVKPVTGKSETTHDVTGNLTMKGITKSITFPANITVSEAGIEASTPQFVIDRTQWNIMYGSTLAGVVKDEAIDDKIGLQIKLATK
jgi:polyisoprenoid-binding protein YceI